MLESLRFKKDTIIVNCGRPGDTIRNMSTMHDDPSFQLEIEGGIVWDAILLSGGGNDVIDDAKWIIPASDKPQKVKDKPEKYCDTAHLSSTLDMVIDGYQKLFSIRDGVRSKCKGKPIVIHTYDTAKTGRMKFTPTVVATRSWPRSSPQFWRSGFNYQLARADSRVKHPSNTACATAQKNRIPMP